MKFAGPLWERSSFAGPVWEKSSFASPMWEMLLADCFFFGVFLSFSGTAEDGDADTPTGNASHTLGAASPANDRWEVIKRGAIRYGELLKTSYNHGTDKPHGFSNKRLFRLTEHAIEYYHVYFGQVRVSICLSVCFQPTNRPLSSQQKASFHKTIYI